MNRIVGSGGKSGGGGGGISEDPDTLSSVAFARFVDLVGEGPIKGLVNGDFSIYLDGVPLKNIEGTPNYRPFQTRTTVGTQSQLPIPGFTGTVQENGVGVKLIQTAGKLIRSIPDPDADSVRVTISVNGFSVTASNGKVGQASVEYKISVRVASGSWVTGFQGPLTGKTASRYQRAHEISLKELGPGPYEVAVERITADSSSGLVNDSIYFDAYAIINYEPFSYPNSALVAVEIDGRYFSSVPTRGYHVQGLLIRVPTNYDPVTRVYTGIWDGTFKIAYSNNPAWCFYDLVTNRRYGLGKRISEDQISKWVIYQIGQYCDEPVPTGLSNNVFSADPNSNFAASGVANAGVPVRVTPMEPRFTLNCVINTKQDAYKVLNNLTSVFRGMSYWASGMVTLTQDRPTPVSMQWTNGNVIDGIFTYEGTARTDRHTVCTVSWNDPSEDFRQRFEYVEDREGIIRYGIKPTDYIAFGCTSRSQARRVGLWLLYTERVEKDAIKFRVGLDSARVMPGDVGKILDANRTGARWGGRIISALTDSVTIDAPIHLDIGTYTLSVMAKDGTVVDKAVNIAVAGNYTTLPLAIPYGVAPNPMAIWTLASTTVVPMRVRVITINQVSSSEFDIVALEHNPTKYDAIELGAAFVNFDYSFLSYDKVPAITNLSATENSFKTEVSAAVQSNIEVAWDSISDPLIRGYRMKLVSASGGSQWYPEQRDPYYTILGVVPDTYIITVVAVNQLGIAGPNVSVDLTVIGIDTRPPSDVAGFVSEVQRDGVKFSWQPNNEVDYLETELHLESTWNDATTPLFVGRASTYTLPQVPEGPYDVVAKHRDTSGNMSLHAAHVNDTVPPYVPPADGTPGLTALLSNEAHTVPATSDGHVISFAGADTFMRVFEGVVEDTDNWTFDKVDTNVCSDIVDNHVTVHAWGDSCETKLLLHFDEDEGETVPLDSSVYAHEVVNIGTDVTMSPTHAAYGNAGNFPGAGDNILEIVDFTELQPGASNFAFQIKGYIAALPASGQRATLYGLWKPGSDVTYHSYAVLLDSDGFINFDYSIEGETVDHTVIGPAVTVGVINQIGVARDADVLTITVITP